MFLARRGAILYSGTERKKRSDTVRCAAPKIIIRSTAGTLCSQTAAHRKYSTGNTTSGIGAKRNRAPEQGDLPPTHKIAEPHGIGQKQEQRGKEKPYAPRLDRFPAHR